jgi:hypothetical protein
MHTGFLNYFDAAQNVLYLHQDTIPITMITLKSVLNTKLLLILITSIYY